MSSALKTDVKCMIYKRLRVYFENNIILGAKKLHNFYWNSAIQIGAIVEYFMNENQSFFQCVSVKITYVASENQ